MYKYVYVYSYLLCITQTTRTLYDILILPYIYIYISSSNINDKSNILSQHLKLNNVKIKIYCCGVIHSIFVAVLFLCTFYTHQKFRNWISNLKILGAHIYWTNAVAFDLHCQFTYLNLALLCCNYK